MSSEFPEDVPMKCVRWRSNRNRIYLFLTCAALFLLSKQFGSAGNEQQIDEEDEVLEAVELRNEHKETVCPEPGAAETKCSADGGKPMRCWKDEEDVYFPAAFLKKRFDMTGKPSKDAAAASFELYTSYAKMRTPDEKYDPLGPFGHFSTYSVETRDRVRCISAKTDVPMSTQWDPVPYYYPIQIAQYGLQHYSRMKNYSSSNKTKEGPEEVVVGEKSAEWKGAAGMHDTTERLFFDDEEKGKVLNISAGYYLANAGAYVYLDKSPELHVISFEWKPLDANSSFTVLAKMKEDDLLVLINYVFSDGNGKCVWQEEEKSSDDSEAILRPRKDGQVSYSYAFNGSAPYGEWSTVTRDVLVDVARALSSSENRKKDANVVLHPGDLRLVSLGFRGQLTVKQRISQRKEQHEHAFRASADWLVSNQNAQGGWAVPVERSIADRKLVLPPGWHSAMAQGHGISVLTRAWSHFKELKYLESAVAGLELFKKNASDGGVRASFFGVVWYEEYPTTPGSFVLNGFLYSLIGLYDLSRLPVTSEYTDIDIQKRVEDAGALYRVGVASLKQLLPLYDTGSGTIYDLRHVGLGTAPNLARWDYHAVHVYLLKWIAGLEQDEFLSKTADRWIGYASGKKAKHN